MNSPLPGWFRQPLPDQVVTAQAQRLRVSGVHTVCQEARCPNLSDCFSLGQMTFMILGDYCTRQCSFCAVKRSPQGALVNRREGRAIAHLLQAAGADYAVLTSVTRDDLPDGGAAHYAASVAEIQQSCPGIRIELLIPDFRARHASLEAVANSRVCVIGHNVETVSRLYPLVRPGSDYQRSLTVLRLIREINPRVVTKSALMVGMGESAEEVLETLSDLKGSGCDIAVIGQYLAPSANHYPVRAYIHPEQFDRYAVAAREMGFASVVAGPKVRSSYRAAVAYEESLACTTV